MTFGWPPLRRRGVFIGALAGCAAALAVSFFQLGRDF